MAHLLITGGAGFIGSHTSLELLAAGHSLVVLDNFVNGSPEPLRRVAELADLSGWREVGPGRWATAARGEARISLVEGDVRRAADLERIFESGETIEAVIHFAGLKAVAESVEKPLPYWDVNVAGSLRLLEAMHRNDCRTLVFSSTAAVYGHPQVIPIPEEAAIDPINPYGRSKAAVERLLADVVHSDTGWRIARLRYFNPVGAHPSGRIGEDPCGTPTNLFPLILRVAAGDPPFLAIYGSDWPTPDGTGVRDYIHVMDLAAGHRTVVELLLEEGPQLVTLNLGSGRGHSVLEVVRTFEAVTGRSVPCEFRPRRSGDAAISVADPSEAQRRLGWRTRRTLADMCRDGWLWHRENPRGYAVRQPDGMPGRVGMGREDRPSRPR